MLLVLFVMASCDNWADHTYTVTNNSSSVVTIKTDFSEEYDFETGDSIHIIKPGDSKKIIDEMGTMCGLKEHPKSWYSSGDVVPQPKYRFDIYVGETLMPTLRLYQYWTFETGKSLGKYELVVTDELVDELYVDE